jgi:hypothetical protein
MVRQRLQQHTGLVGRPELVAIRQSNAGAVPETRYEALFWPVPDSAYVLEYRYRIHPVMLAMTDGDGTIPGVTDGASQPEGGQAHAQTLVESCLLACDELMKRDARIRTESFYRCLTASVGFDRRVNSPASLGYNSDRGMRSRSGDYRDLRSNVVTYTPR